MTQQVNHKRNLARVEITNKNVTNKNVALEITWFLNKLVGVIFVIMSLEKKKKKSIFVKQLGQHSGKTRIII